MEKLLNLILERPELVLASGIGIPCALYGYIEREDDEAVTLHRSTQPELPVSCA